MNLFTKQKQTHRLRKQAYGYQRGKVRQLDGIADNGHEFEQALGVSDGQGSLEGCSPWGCKESDMAE